MIDYIHFTNLYHIDYDKIIIMNKFIQHYIVYPKSSNNNVINKCSDFFPCKIIASIFEYKMGMT